MSPRRRRVSPSASASSSEDEQVQDDPIVKRLQVYYTPHYSQSLSLLQFPDKPQRPDTRHPLLPLSLRPTNDSNSHIQAHYKPQSQSLSLSIPIERHLDRYDLERGNKFGQGVLDQQERLEAKDAAEGRSTTTSNKRARKPKVDQQQQQQQEEEEEERQRLQQVKDNKMLDSITYTSTLVPDTTNYLVGIVKDDSLHLTPLLQTLQLRPSLTYLDHLLTLARRSKREARNLDDASDSEGDISDAELKKEEAKAVMVAVKQSKDLSGGGAFGRGGGGAGAGPGNGRAGAGLFARMRAEEGEAWQRMEYCHADTPQSERAFERLFITDQGANVRLRSVTKPKEYLGVTK